MNALFWLSYISTGFHLLLLSSVYLFSNDSVSMCLAVTGKSAQLGNFLFAMTGSWAQSAPTNRYSRFFYVGKAVIMWNWHITSIRKNCILPTLPSTLSYVCSQGERTLIFFLCFVVISSLLRRLSSILYFLCLYLWCIFQRAVL